MVVVALSALLLACGGDDDDATRTPTEVPTSGAASASATPTEAVTATTAPEDTQAPTTGLSVTLTEYEVTTDSDSGRAGDYTFAIANEGEEGHVFMIVQTDLAADELPVTSTGQFAPSGEATILANTPNINGGGTDSFTYTLEAGSYVFICNNVGSDGLGHYREGMSTGFTVE